jgi:hypothetical protein
LIIREEYFGRFLYDILLLLGVYVSDLLSRGAFPIDSLNLDQFLIGDPVKYPILRPVSVGDQLVEVLRVRFLVGGLKARGQGDREQEE